MSIEWHGRVYVIHGLCGTVLIRILVAHKDAARPREVHGLARRGPPGQSCSSHSRTKLQIRESVYRMERRGKKNFKAPSK